MDDLTYRNGFHHTNDFRLDESSKQSLQNDLNENLYKSKSYVWTKKESSLPISLKEPNKMIISNPIVLPNVKIPENSMTLPNKKKNSLFIKELNADNYAILSAQWHENRKKAAAAIAKRKF